MNNVPRKLAAGATSGVLNGLQQWPAHVQIVGAAMVFWRLCKVLGVQPYDVLGVCNNLFSDGIKPAPEFRAADRYINEIIRKKL